MSYSICKRVYPSGEQMFLIHVKHDEPYWGTRDKRFKYKHYHAVERVFNLLQESNDDRQHVFYNILNYP